MSAPGSLRKRLKLFQHESGQRGLCQQVLRGVFIGFLLVPILSACFTLGAISLGYRFGGAFGTSMEPVLHDGDMLWLKRSNITETSIGDIVILFSPESGSISHRVISIEPISGERYLVETKGDANLLSENWLVGPDDTVYTVVRSIRSGGYILAFIDNLYVKILLICIATVVLIVMHVQRTRVKQRHAGSKLE